MSGTYARFGVDIAEGDTFSAFAGKICADSNDNCPFVSIHDLSNGHFRGPKGWGMQNLPDGYLLHAAPDGIGTKVIIIDAAGNHIRAAQDVFAMTAGDITRWGGMPAIFCNVLDVATLDKAGTSTNEACKQMMFGLGKAARYLNVVCYSGETAELGATVTSENPDATVKFNWAGFMIGVLLPDRIIRGETLAEGQVVVALHEPGCRSNGISSVRGGLRIRYGDEWWKNPEAKDDIAAAAQPSTLYDLFLTDANGWTFPVSHPRFKMHLIAHISGGGIVGKFGEDLLFPYGFSAELTDLFEPSEIHRKVVDWTNTPEREAYEVFPSGTGALVVLDEQQVTRFTETASNFGIRAKRAGVITRSNKPYLSITSGYSGKVLEYRPKAE